MPSKSKPTPKPAYLTDKQWEAVQGFTQINGFDMIGMEDVESGEQTFVQFWEWNREHLHECHLECERQTDRLYPVWEEKRY